MLIHRDRIPSICKCDVQLFFPLQFKQTVSCVFKYWWKSETVQTRGGRRQGEVECGKVR